MIINSKCIIEAAVSKDESRMVLSEPFLDLSEKDKPVMVSTDGRIMAIIPVQVEPVDVQGPINQEALKQARKLPQAKKNGIVAIDCNGVCKLENGSTIPRDGNFPEGGSFPTQWRNCFPKLDHSKKPLVRVSFDLDLLVKLARAMGTTGIVFTMEADDEGNVSKGIIVHPTTVRGIHPPEHGAKCALMPMRLQYT